MRDTEILLREHVKDLGRCGDIVRVAPGYARNYLIPKGIGIPANEDNKLAMARRRERLDAEEVALFAKLDERLGTLTKLVLKTTQRADDHGHLYGSVSPQVIVGLLAEAGHTIAEKDVRLEKPIKAVGTHTVGIHLHAERSGEIMVQVLAEGAEEVPADDAGEDAAEPAEAESESAVDA